MEKGILREKYRGAVRRVFLAVFFFAAMFLLSACGNAGSGVPEDSSDMAEAEEPGLAVLLVTDSKIAEDSIEDRTRNGIENFLKKHPSCTLEEIVETDARKAVPRASGYDAAVFVGASFSGIGEAAGEQRDSRFIVIDTTVADAEGEVLSLPNVCTVTFRAEEEGFLAGVGTYGTENTGLEIGDVKSDGDGITIRDAQDQIITQIRREPQGIVCEELEKVYAGTFRGQDLIVGVREGCIDYVSEDGKHLLTADALRKLKLTKDMIISEEPYGKIT